MDPEANVTHSDFHAGNLLTAIKDHSKFQLLEDAEIEDPAPQKHSEDRTIYLPRGLQRGVGPLILCDFGEARIGNEHQGSAMPTPYRAPEIIIGITWGHSVDMWAVGLVAWDLLESESLLRWYHLHDKDLNDAHHLADMIALLGPPPLEFLRHSDGYLKFWDEHGNWRSIDSLEAQGTTDDGD